MAAGSCSQYRCKILFWRRTKLGLLADCVLLARRPDTRAKGVAARTAKHCQLSIFRAYSIDIPYRAVVISTAFPSRTVSPRLMSMYTCAGADISRM